MKRIPLHGKSSRGLAALIDDGDLDLVVRYRWHAKPGSYTIYAKTTIYENGRPRTLQMHSLILGVGPRVEVDHRDSDGLNNQRHNLRVATHGRNRHHTRRGWSASGFRGVSWHRGEQKWCAYINHEGQRHNLGYFTTPEAAALAYNAKAHELFGEFATPNIVGIKA